MKLATALQMRECDRRTIAGENLPAPTDGLTLMERAGWGIFSALRRKFASLRQRPILIFCGPGNNGGDGFVLARLLNENQMKSVVLLLGQPDKLSPDCTIQYDRFSVLGGRTLAIDSEEALASGVDGELNMASQFAPLLVDAMLGTGSRGAPRGLMGDAVAGINALRKSHDAEVVAVDIPTGVDTDSGQTAGDAVMADLTVSMAYAKPGFYFYPGKEHVGQLAVVDIGIPATVEADVGLPISLMDRRETARLLPVPEPTTHKGRQGRLLIVGGSIGLSGAPVLAAEGALQSGAGLITVAVPQELNSVLESKLTEAMTLPVPQTEAGGISHSAGELLREKLTMSDACLIGPGLGREEASLALARSLLGACHGGLVIDADGLFALAENESWRLPAQRWAILTPHPGEMARLLGLERLASSTSALWEKAAQYGKAKNCIVVLKGATTVVAAPDGEIWINSSGNPGLATGGSGDVLSGVIASFLAQGMAPLDAARLGVYLHGFAADRLCAAVGTAGVTPLALCHEIPMAWQDLAGCSSH
jgi:ADP-dependent NAD(P)H-hydrate dehydratase / NAD(P)H-hydrate epimerase